MSNTPAPPENPTPNPEPNPTLNPAPADPANPAPEGDPAPEFTPYTPEALELPQDIPVDEGLRDGFIELANKHKLAPELVKDLVTLQTEAAKKAGEAQSALWDQTQSEWQDQIRADPEFGGQKLDANLGAVSKLIDQFGGKEATELRQALDYTGAGNQPHILRFMFRVAKALGEGTPVSGGPASPGQRSPAETLFPNQGKK